MILESSENLKSYMKCIKFHFNSKRKVRSSDTLLPSTGIEMYTDRAKLSVTSQRYFFQAGDFH